MIACDTSVLVAAFARWHDGHARARTALVRVDAMIDHVAVETFSVLTRLPQPRRADPGLVAEFLDHHFPPTVPRLPGPGSTAVLRTARSAGISGGATYDLLVGLAATVAGATILSLDRRAATTYLTAGVTYELLA